MNKAPISDPGKAAEPISTGSIPTVLQVVPELVTGGVERGTLEIDVAARIAHGDVEGGMSQPLADRGEVNAGFQQG